jgi:methionyl-tRNA formyltransferase
VYLGTPDMAVPPLRALVDGGFDIALVVTRPDKRRGRGSTLTPSPVKAAALDLGLPVTSTVADALDVGADLGVVVAFGRIIAASVLAELPMVNLHFSLLPRWRGAAPVERALLAGDEVTGVDVMAVEEGLDTGGVHAESVVPIGPDTTAAELRSALVAEGSRLLVETLRAGLGQPRPQVGEPTYAEKLQPGEYELDWTRPATELHRWVRLGGAWTTFRGRRLKIWRATPSPTGDGVDVPTGDGVLELLEVQPEGKPRMDAAAWANGARPKPGELGTVAGGPDVVPAIPS